MTIDAPEGFHEFFIGESNRPQDIWTSSVSNERGWWLETRMRVDALNEAPCAFGIDEFPQVNLWVTDDTHRLVRIGFTPEDICLIPTYGEGTVVPLDATAFHVYRISVQGTQVSVYVDGALVIKQEHVRVDEAVTGITFGDMRAAGGPSRSYWDYLTYDVSGP